MIRSIICAAIVSSAAFAGIARADDTVVETVVTTRGVDFNQADQTARFYKTLHAAAEKVCDVPGDAFSIRADNKDCEARAIDEAVRDTNNPQLTRLHQEAMAVRDDKVTQTASRNW
jgi:UrcA family protein